MQECHGGKNLIFKNNSNSYKPEYEPLKVLKKQGFMVVLACSNDSHRLMVELVISACAWLHPWQMRTSPFLWISFVTGCEGRRFLPKRPLSATGNKSQLKESNFENKLCLLFSIKCKCVLTHKMRWNMVTIIKQKCGC